MAGCVATVLNAKAERTMCVVAKGARNLSCWKTGERQLCTPCSGILTAERGWDGLEAVLSEALRVAWASEPAAFRISQYGKMRGGRGGPSQRGNLWQGKQCPSAHTSTAQDRTVAEGGTDHVSLTL